MPQGVAQTSSLLYRGFPIRTCDQAGTACRLEVGDTAGWKPALHSLGGSAFRRQARAFTGPRSCECERTLPHRPRPAPSRSRSPPIAGGLPVSRFPHSGDRGCATLRSDGQPIRRPFPAASGGLHQRFVPVLLAQGVLYDASGLGSTFLPGPFSGRVERAEDGVLQRNSKTAATHAKPSADRSRRFLITGWLPGAPAHAGAT